MADIGPFPAKIKLQFSNYLRNTRRKAELDPFPVKIRSPCQQAFNIRVKKEKKRSIFKYNKKERAKNCKPDKEMILSVI